MSDSLLFVFFLLRVLDVFEVCVRVFVCVAFMFFLCMMPLVLNALSVFWFAVFYGCFLCVSTCCLFVCVCVCMCVFVLRICGVVLFMFVLYGVVVIMNCGVFV